MKTSVISNLRCENLDDFFRDSLKIIIPRIKSALKEKEALKVIAKVAWEFNITKNDQSSKDTEYFTDRNIKILNLRIYAGRLKLIFQD